MKERITRSIHLSNLFGTIQRSVWFHFNHLREFAKALKLAGQNCFDCWVWTCVPAIFVQNWEPMRKEMQF